MAEKYNHERETAKLADITATKPATGALTKEEFRETIMSNLPMADNEDVRDLYAFLGIEKPTYKLW